VVALKKGVEEKKRTTAVMLKKKTQQAQMAMTLYLGRYRL